MNRFSTKSLRDIFLLFILLFSSKLGFSQAHTVFINGQTNSSMSVACAGQCNVTLVGTVSGGVGPYHFNWYCSNCNTPPVLPPGSIFAQGDTAAGTSTGNTFVSNMCADTYTLEVEDQSNGTFSYAQIIVNQPAALIVNFTQAPGYPFTAGNPPQTSVTCNGSCDAGVNANFIGGTGGKTFYWVPAIVPNVQNPRNLCPGTDSIYVTDANGCKANKAIIVNEPPVVSSGLSVTQPTCAVATGSASVVPAGGNGGAYTVLWSTGASTTSISGLAPGNYWVEVKDNKSCEDSIGFTISTPTPPNITLNSQTATNCSNTCNGTANVTASGGVSPYFWSNTAITATTTYTGLCSGNNTITVTDQNSCTASITVNIAAPAPFTVDAGVDKAICDGQSTMLSATPSAGAGISYAWVPNGAGMTPSSGLSQNVTVSPTTTTTYTVTATNGAGCVDDDQITVTVNPLPNITATPSLPEFCSGDSINITANGAGAGGSYTWAPTSFMNPSAGNTQVVIVKPPTDTTYTLTGTDANGCSATISVPVTVNPLPPISISGLNNVCNGFCTTLTASGAGAGGTYTWSPATGLIPNNTSNPVDACPTSNTTYTVTGTDANGCSNTATITITVHNNPTADAGADVDICLGTSTTLNGSGNPGPIVSCLWTTTGDGLTNPNSCSTTVTPTISSTYQLEVTDGFGCKGTDQVTVTVNPLPNINITPASVGLCQGLSANLTASGAGAGGTYQWSPTTSMTPAAGNTASVSVAPVSSITYTAVGTDANGCVGQDTVRVTVFPAPNVAVSGNTTICPGGCTTLTVSGANTYSWNTGSTATSITVCPATTTTYTVTGTNTATGCTKQVSVTVTVATPPVANAGPDKTICNGTSTNLSALPNGMSSYVWTGPNMTPASGLSQTINVAPASTSTYTLTVTDAIGCTGTDQIVVSVLPALNVNAGRDTFICMGNPIQLAATGGSNYQWTDLTNSPSCIVSGDTTATPTVNPTVTTTLVVLGTSGTCSKRDTIVISVNPLPVPIAGQDKNVCIGSSVTLSASGGLNYSWSPSTGLSAPNNAVTDANPTTTTTYTVTVTDANGCSDSDRVNVFVRPLPIADAGPDVAICQGSATTLNGSGGTSCEWLNSDPGLNIYTSCNPVASPMTTTTYDLVVTDAFGCQDTDQVVVTVNTISGSAGADVVYCAGTAGVQITASGGTLYNWSPATGLDDPNSANPTASPTATTTYTVTITDNNGCSVSDDVVVTYDQVSGTIAATNPSNCGVTDGVLNLTVTSGVAGYTYLWNPGGATSEDLSGVGAGAYSVTITDANGCTGSVNGTLNNTSAMTLTETHTDPTTCSGTNGAIDLTVTGSVGPPTYNWTPGNIATEDLSNLGDGTYTVTVTDVNGCIKTLTVTLNDPTPTPLDAGSNVVLCRGSNVTLNATPGFATYSWTPSSSLTNANTASPTAQPNSSVTYTVTAVDANQCVSTDALIVQVVALPVANAGSDAMICSGASYNLNASGGTSYLWAANSTLSQLNIPNPIAGNVTTTTTYYVTVTNSFGCSKSDSVTISVDNISLTETHNDASACGASDGSIDITVVGGTPSFTYSWSPNSDITQDVTGLGLGAYTVTVTDNIGCTTDLTVNIQQPSLLTLSGVVTDATSCGGNQGSINLTVSGSSGTVTYSWENQSTGAVIATTEDVSGLGAGTYVVSVNDANGCAQIASFTVNQPLSATVSAGSDLITCDEDSVTLTASASGAGNTFSWTPTASIIGSSTGQTITAYPGVTTTYTVTVTTPQGCTSQDSVIVNVSGMVITATVSNVTICGGSDGAITVNVSNGTAPYTYDWVNSSATTPTINNLPVGAYTVIITDFNGCIDTLTNTTVADPSNISVIGVATDISNCMGVNDGAIDISVTGGTGAYTYNWTGTGISQGVEDQNNLAAGNYSVVVTDAANCSGSAGFVIDPSAPINADAGQDIFTCSGSSVNLNATGGTTYTWTPASSATHSLNDPNIANPIATVSNTTTLVVTVSDAGGCTGTDTVTIFAAPLVLSETHIDPTTCGATDGSIDLTVSGGNAPYTYSWSGTQTSEDLSGLGTSINTVTVTDNSSCTATLTVTIQGQTAVTASGVVTDATDCGAANGAIDVTDAGGTPPVTYSWVNQNDTSVVIGTNQDISGIPAGTYGLTITEASGCKKVIAFTVNEPAAPTAIAGSDVTVCLGASVQLNGDTTGAVNTISWSGGTLTNGNTLTPTASPLTTTTYTLTVTSIGGCQSSDDVTVNVIDINLSAATTDVTTCGGSDGTVTITASGGTSPYDYTWSNGALNNQSAIGLPLGPINVTVTDLNGCSDSLTNILINEPSSITATGIVTDVTTCGGTNGGIDVTPAGGTNPYTFQWTGTGVNVNAEDQTGLSAGTYNVVVRDSNNCGTTVNFTVNDPAPVVASIGNTNSTVCSGSTVNLTATGGGTYSWTPAGLLNDPNAANPVATVITTTTFVVTVTASNGCSDTASVTVNANPLVLSETHADVSACGQNDGNINLTVTGGSPGYIYDWSNGETTQDIDTLSVNGYTVIVTDQLGCADTLTVNIQGPSSITGSGVVTDLTACNSSDGAIDITLTGGVLPITYIWTDINNNTISTSQDLSNLDAGIYSVLATEATGCSYSQSFTVNAPATPVMSAGGDIFACNGGNIQLNGSASGTGNSINWSFSAGTMADNTILNPVLSTTTSTVCILTVTTPSGCTASDTVNINLVDIALASSVTDATTCLATDGSISITASGGQGTYNYAWTPSGPNAAINSGLGLGVYNVVVTDQTGCSDSLINITVNAPSGVTVASNVTNVSSCVASNGTIDITPSGGTPPYTFNWSGTGIIQGVEDQSGLAAGAYSVVVTDANNCGQALSFAINSPTPVQANAGPDISICPGSSIQIFADTAGITNFSWTPGPNVTPSNVFNPVANPAVTTIYQLSVVDTNGCSSSDQVTITVLPAPVVSAGSDLNLCTSSANVLNGSGGVTYQWSPASGLSQTNIANPAVNVSVTTTYYLTAVDANGCSGSDSVKVVKSVLALTASTVDPTGCTSANGSIDLTVSGGQATYTYLWSANAGSALTEDLNGLDNGIYTVHVTDANGCSDSVTAILNDPATFQATSTSSSPANCNGNDGSIDVTVTGTPAMPVTYLWNNSVTTEDITGTAGIYFNTITDLTGCQFIITDTIVDPTATPVSAGSDFSICNGDTAFLNVTAGVSYSWTPTSGLDFSNIQSPVANPTGTTSYIVSVTDNKGCVASDTVVVNVNNLIVADSHTDVSSCSGTDGIVNLTVLGGSGNYSYSWTNQNNVSVSATEDLNGIGVGVYTVVVTDNTTGCDESYSVTITEPTPYTYTETHIDPATCGGTNGSIDLTVTGGASPFTYNWTVTGVSVGTTEDLNAIAQGTYDLTMSDASGCTGVLSVILNEPAPISVSAGSDQNICIGNSVQLNATSIAGATYSWSPSTGLSSSTVFDPVANPVTTTNYTLTVTDANNCQAVANVSVNVTEILLNPVVTDASSCISTDGALSIAPSGGAAPYTVNWPALGSSALVQPALSTGNYIVIVTEGSSLACSVTDTLSVNSLVPLSLNTGNDINACLSSQVVLHATAQPVSGTSYSWTLTPSATVIGTDSTLTISPVLGTSVYEINATNGFCSATDQITVLIEPDPQVEAGTEASIIVGEYVTLGGNPTTGAGNTIAWTPVEFINDPSIENPVANPNITTTYYVTVTSPVGCTAQDSVIITVYPEISFPSGFTPNGDGKNDTWVIDFIEKFPQAEVQVFNRWGQNVFTSAAGYTVPWDGTYNNNPVPVGTYYFIIDLKSDKYKPYTGPITIMR